MKDTAKLIKLSRERAGMSQEQLAYTVGITQATWSKYENGKVAMPDDIARRAIKVLRDPKLKLQCSFIQGTGLVNTPLLNNIDENIITGLVCLIEEAKEAIESSERLVKKLRNRQGKKDICKDEWEEVLSCEEQIVDLYPALNMHFVRMTEVYGLDIEEMERRASRKLRERKYIR